MMPTFPSSPLKFRTAGFPRYGFKAGVLSRCLPASGVHQSRPLGLHPAFVPTAASVRSPLCVGERCAHKHRHSSGHAALPQGPSLRSGLCCPDPSTLIRPHPPHSQAQCDFTALQLIRPVLAVRFRLGDPRLVPSFHCSFFLNMSSSTNSGESSGCMHPVPSPPTLAFVPLAQTRHSQNSPQIRFTWGMLFGASLRFTCATTC